MGRVIPYFPVPGGHSSPLYEPAAGPLTPEEANSPYAKFYDPSRPDVPEEIMQVFLSEGQMNPEDALLSNNINDILKDGYLKTEIGYCSLADGGAYAAVLHKMPELSCDVFLWFMQWWGGKDIGYKLWCPGYHYKSAMGWINEDVGNGPEDIVFTKELLLPEDFAFDPVLYSSSATRVVCSSNGISKPSGSLPEALPTPMVVGHFIRPIGKGMELRSRFWLGYACVPNEGLKCILPEGVKIPVEKARNIGIHCAHEFSYLKRVAPKVYAEYGNQ